MKNSQAFVQAQELLNQQPLPADAEKQLAALEKKILPSEREMFGDLWSTFMLLTGPAAAIS